MNFLEQILEVKKEEVNKLKQRFSLGSFREMEFYESPIKSLRSVLRREDRLGIIAEIKKASPSKGVLKQNFDHIGIAKTYIENEVDAISVLTDKNFFQGDISFLKNIARFKNIPLLRKDFIIDEYQIFEAKANGADAILLIAEVLSQNQINELTGAAKECGVEVLLEIHSESQLKKIDFAKNNLVGINNRNLETFNVELAAALELSKLIPKDVVLVAESGINTIADIEKICVTNISAVLVGEHFMKSSNIGESVQEFKEWCKRAS